MLVHVVVPSAEIRITGRGARYILRDLRRLYKDKLIIDEEPGQEDYQEPDWNRKRPARIKPGAALRVCRCSNRLSLAALAEVSGVPKGHLSQMENGKRPIGKRMAQKLADALGCDYRGLL